MGNRMKITAGLVALAALAGCMESGGAAVATLSPAEQTCLDAVRSETNNPEAVVGSAQQIAGGTRVIVAVGPQQAPWQCDVGNDGALMSRPMSLTDEGAA